MCLIYSNLRYMEYKVVHFISSIDLSSGGPARSMPAICLGIKALGVKCEVHSFASTQPNDKKLRENGIAVSLYSPPKNIIFSLFDKTFLSNIELTHAVVHLQNIWDPSLHWVANKCKRENIPYIISPRGMLEPWSLSQKRIKKKIAMWLYQMADLKHASCIHTTAFSEMEHVKSLGIKCPIAVIPNGINVEDYPEKDYSINHKGKKRMLFLSRIHPKKGIDLLLRAWSLLPLELLNKWELVIAGEGDKTYSLEDLNEMIKEKFNNLGVIVVGPQYGINKINMYHSADVFVLPTYSENFGMVIAEAMCCGIPVITTSGTPWVELKNKQIGWYIDLSVENLKIALIDAMNRKDDELRFMGRLSRKLILSEYSIEAVTKKYKELYNWINGGKQKPNFIY